MEPLHPFNLDNNAAGTTLDANEPMLVASAKDVHHKLFMRGRKWLCAGLFFLACSFGVNFLLFQTETSFTAFMYALTTMGAVCVTKGLVDILGF